MYSALFSFLHFTAVFGIVATLFFEWLTLSRSPTYVEARRIQLCDAWYGIFAAVLVAAGLLRVYYFEKGKDFYLPNPFFRAKIGLFVLVGLLSIAPTVKFLGWRKETRRGLPPVVTAKEYSLLIMLLRLELLGLLGAAFCATLMARGITL
jgi:putative membrane protein